MEPLLSLKDTAKLMNCSTDTVLRRVKNEKLPCIGKKFQSKKFRKSVIQAWIEREEQQI